ncbi:MAG: HIT domain-containing protein [Nitrospirae bacterium]|nr:HIT domain-containing protein [Nitrospirota bacterium]
MNQLRREPLLGRWIAVLEHSLKPDEYAFSSETSSGTCHICQGGGGNEEVEVLYDADGNWIVKVVRDSISVFAPYGDLGRKGKGMYDLMNSYGETELVIESPEHDVPPEDRGREHMALIIDLFLRRVTELEKDEKIRYVMVHKNYGLPSGDTSGHPHSLITATPVIPMRIKAELDGAKHYYGYKERCIFCDILREELRLSERVIMDTEHYLVFCPFAARFPFEFWILPKRHNCSFKEINEDEKNDLATVMTVMLKRLRKVLGNPPYNYVLHTAPSRIPRMEHWHTLGEDFHWHIEVMPRIKRLTGFELGSGMYILSTSPEDASKYLKEVSDGD